MEDSLVRSIWKAYRFPLFLFLYFLFISLVFISPAWSQKAPAPIAGTEKQILSSVKSVDVKGKVPVKWFKPNFTTTPTQAPYKISIRGRTSPGALIIKDGGLPETVGQSGDIQYNFMVEKEDLDKITEIQVISPFGDTTRYIVTLRVPKPVEPEKPSKVADKAADKMGSSSPPKPKELLPLPKVKAPPGYSFRMMFDPLENGVELEPQVLDYEVTQDAFKLSDFTFGPDFMTMALDRSADKTHIKFIFPALYGETKKIEIVDPKGNQLYEESVNLPRGKAATLGFVSRDYSAQDLPLVNASKFQFCAYPTSDVAAVMCSPFYRYDKASKQVQVLDPEGTSGVLINGKGVPLAGQVQLKDGKSRLNLKVHLSNGAQFKFHFDMIPLEFRDIVLSDDGSTVKLSGRGVPPIGASVFQNEKISAFETVQNWTVSFPIDKPFVQYASDIGFIIRQDFKLTQDLPREGNRPWLKDTSLFSSYTSGARIDGYAPQKVTYKFGKRHSNTPKNNFAWLFQHSERGEFKKNHVNFDTGDLKYSAYHEMYQGYPFEVSSRLTGIMSSKGMWVLGEFAGGAWMESLFGWRNYYLTDRRWGLNARYVKSLFASKNDPQLTTITAEARYRFVPGLWNADESVGATIGYQQIAYTGYQDGLGTATQASMLGLGLFWARSMPDFFDKLFNIVPFFRYPKWVDMEAIYYFNAMDTNTLLGSSNYSLTFHGKMFLKSWFFLEASFGLRSFSYTDVSKAYSQTVSMFFGTGGLGINF